MDGCSHFSGGIFPPVSKLILTQSQCGRGRRTKEGRTVFRRTTFSLAFLHCRSFLHSLSELEKGENERRGEGYDKNTPCGFSTVEVYRVVRLDLSEEVKAF